LFWDSRSGRTSERQKLVSGNPKEPNSKRLLNRQLGQTSPCLEKSFLRQVLGDVLPPRHAGKPGTHWIPVPIDQSGKCRPVASPCPAYTLTFLVGIHVSPTLLPRQMHPLGFCEKNSLSFYPLSRNHGFRASSYQTGTGSRVLKCRVSHIVGNQRRKVVSAALILLANSVFARFSEWFPWDNRPIRQFASRDQS